MIKTFIIRLLIFGIAISVISYFLFSMVLPQYYLPVFPFLILFFIITTIGIHLILTKAGKKEIRQFSTYYMGSVTAKLLIYLIFIVIYAFTHRETAIPFVITFFVLYVLFTFFEIYSILGHLRKITNNNTRDEGVKS